MTNQQKLIVNIANKWIGTPYRHQASRIGAGCDCLGLLRGIWREIMGKEPVKIPPYKADWRDRENASSLLEAAETYLQKKQNNQPKEADIILFQMIKYMPPKHCAIMVENNYFIHAQEHIGVVKAPLSEAWNKKIHSVYKFPEK